MSGKVRITDIAKKAGVSAGTVDRVLHGRGNVSNKSREKIMKALEELNYTPNLLASILAYNKTWRFAVLIPDGNSDPFWAQPRIGIEKAKEGLQDYGIQIEYFLFPENNAKEFEVQANKILNDRFDGLIVAPLFTEESIRIFQACEKNKLPFVQINTQIDVDSEYMISYIGQDSYGSGRLAAKLLGFGLKENDVILVCHLEENVYNAQHLLDKEKGFQDYIEKDLDFNVRLFNINYNQKNGSETLDQYIKNVLNEHPEISAIFVSTSRAYRIIKAIPIEQLNCIRITGFDLIPENLQYLNENKIDFLINQNPLSQGFLSIQSMFNFLVKKQQPPLHQYLPLDVVMKENVLYYEQSIIKDAELRV